MPAVELHEGSMLLPSGWGGRSQILFYEDGGDGRMVVSFGPKEESFDETLSQASTALIGFQLLDRRRIIVDDMLGDYAELTFVLLGKLTHQILVRLPLRSGRDATFQVSLTGGIDAATRSTYLEAICSFQDRLEA